jgi:hypothetical protein
VNKEKILFVGVGVFQTLAIKQLRDKGYYVIGADGSPNAGGRSFCDEFHLIDFKLVKNFIALAERENIAFAVCVECDPAIIIVNEINKKLGKNHLNNDACQASDNKEVTRTLQKKLTLPHPQFYHINSFEALDSLMDKYENNKKRWVLKPKSSSGSRGVILLDEKSDLLMCYQQSIDFAKHANEGLLLEEFIIGQEIALDGFVVNGEVNVLTVSYKDRSPLPYLLDEGLFITAEVNTSLVQEGKQQLQRLFMALQREISAPFHVEMIVGEQIFFIVEFSFRGAGFNVFSRWIPEVSGVNTIEQQVQQINNKPLALAKLAGSDNEKKQGNSLYIGFLSGQNGILKAVSGEGNIKNHPQLLAYEFYPKIGQQIKLLTSGADRVGHIVMKSNDHVLARTLFEDLAEKLVLSYE